jgi:hypothetical protein
VYGMMSWRKRPMDAETRRASDDATRRMYRSDARDTRVTSTREVRQPESRQSKTRWQ